MMELPLTERKNSPASLWAQREYVECLKRGIGFTCHSTGDRRGWHWHYLLNNAVVVTLEVKAFADEAVEIVRFPVINALDWIEEARAAMAKLEQSA